MSSCQSYPAGMKLTGLAIENDKVGHISTNIGNSLHDNGGNYFAMLRGPPRNASLS